MKRLQEIETSPAAYDTVLTIVGAFTFDDTVYLVSNYNALPTPTSVSFV